MKVHKNAEAALISYILGKLSMVSDIHDKLLAERWSMERFIKHLENEKKELRAKLPQSPEEENLGENVSQCPSCD
jgi:hypothetical protein